MIRDPLAAATAIEQARRASHAIAEAEQRAHVAARARRAAIEQAIAAGMTATQVATALGLTKGRISQIRR